jgi:hypothetical protein
MTNQYPGLARGSIDRQASAVINAIANAAISMGDVVKLVAAPATELLPRVTPTTAQGEESYGIVIGGDVDGIYGTGAAASDDTTRAANAAGQGVEVCVRGRCLARVTGTITLGLPLTVGTTGALEPAASADVVIAVALQASTTADIIAVQVGREGVL